MTQSPESPARSDSFRPVLGAAVFLAFALLAIAGLKGNRDLQAARSRERTLTEKIAATRAESERLRVRIDRLSHDPGMLERLAREDLGLVRPGDMIIELPDPGAPPPPFPAAAPPAVVPVAVAIPTPPSPAPVRPPVP
ncbi:MAG TPA: septum formation initiator family protein [Thermoanaerobaculia bacterium]|nr:septum formation initiator family protein [Thermoanaerobaculia bacterium]